MPDSASNILTLTWPLGLTCAWQLGHQMTSSPKRPNPKRFEQRRIFAASAKMIAHYKELSFLEQIELCRIWVMASMVWEGVTAPQEADHFLDILRARMHEDLAHMARDDALLSRRKRAGKMQKADGAA
jgi:hypothetical protein